MSRKRPLGVTLIELLVAVAIIGIVSAVSVAYYGIDPERHASAAASKQMKSMFDDARMEAIRNGQSAIIAADGIARIRVVRDTNNNAAVDNADIVRSIINLPAGMILETPPAPVMFNNRGYLVDQAQALTALDMVICQSDPESPNSCLSGGKAYHVKISPMGLTSLE